MPSKLSVRKTRRLRALLAKHYKLPDPPPEKDDLVDQVVATVLWLDAPAPRAERAFEELRDEFVDWNELRVTVTTDIGRVLEGCGLPPVKGAIIKRILAKAVEDFFCFDFEALRELPRGKLKGWWVDIPGLPHDYAAAILYYIYDYDRVLVGPDIARLIHRLGLVEDGVAPEEIERRMEGVMPARDALEIYSALRQHARTICTPEDYDCTKCPFLAECVTGKRRAAELKAAAREKKKPKRKKAAKRKVAAKRKTTKRPAKTRKKPTKKKAPRKKAATKKAPGRKAPAKKAARKKTARKKTTRKKVSRR